MSFISNPRRILHRAVFARSVSRFGDEVAAFALVLRLRPAGPWAVSAVLIANLVPIVVLSGVVGRLVDRVDNRRLLAWPACAQLVICLGLAAVHSPVAGVLLVGVLGVGQALTTATWQALLPSLVPAAEVGRALGLAQAGSTLALMAAPGCAGLLVAGLGTHLPLLVDAATFAAVAVIARRLSTGRVLAAGGTPDVQVRGGWSIVRRNPRLRAIITLLGFSVLLGSMVNVVEVFLVRDVLHAEVIWYGAAGTSYALGMFGAAVLGGRVKTYLRPFFASTIALHLGLIAMGLSPSVAWLLTASLVTGGANGLLNVSTSALVTQATPPDSRGRVAAVLGGVLAAAQLGAYISGGAVATALSPRAIFVVAGVAGTLAPLVLGRAVLRHADGSMMQSPPDTPRVRRLLHRPPPSTGPGLGSAGSGRLGPCARPWTRSSPATAESPPVSGC